MKRVVSGFVAALFILTFVTCVYAYGTNARFSLELYIERLCGLESVGLLSDVVKCWTEDSYNAASETAGPGGGDDSGGVTYNVTYYEEYEGENEILQFFDTVRGFFRRVYRSFWLTGKAFITLFEDIELLIPWNATVETGGST